ncbi:proprotein convertase subtilisin/kexin type 4-like [Mercenaria mercenaria]|uniref:proprotein convertase subtilisin/kexin type 4-like n=1 Tax=Mercenaria mercenaria TaxID=6596 RepID=UPI00234ECB4D|nr:proprotein convertase subtilisin/kexin type 4-like [Mercenaria mercenaria]
MSCWATRMDMLLKYVFNATKFVLGVLIFINTVNLTKENIITSRNSQYVFKVGQENKFMLFRRLLDHDFILRHQIIAVEKVRVYEDTLKPEATMKVKNTHNFARDRNNSHNLENGNYYGMGIPKAWSRGYNGEGVTIAVTDVGVNTDLLDLKDNINTELSYNFVKGTTDVTPEFFHNLQEKNITQLLLMLKIYQVKLFNDQIPILEPSHWTASDIISRALVHASDDIDIYANAWAPTKPFDKLDLATRDAIVDSAENGRHGLGTIHVVPSGPPGNGLANSIHTITVNSMGRHGTISTYSYDIDASVLTSGLGDGQNLTAYSMVTTTLKNKCITGFKGVSAATTQISAIIGLAIQANPNISFRDVQHLIVQASEYKSLEESISFTPNGAGRHFHKMFGFGLLNADRIVMLAERHSPVPELFSKTLDSFRKRSSETQTYDVCYTCDMFSRHNCLASIEHVVLEMNKGGVPEHTYIALKSPQGTTSVLLDLKHNQGPSVRKLKLTSVHFWDEIAFGTWRLYVTNNHSSQTDIGRTSLTLYGTANADVPPSIQLPEVICENYTNIGNGSHIARTTNNITTADTSYETLF